MSLFSISILLFIGASLQTLLPGPAVLGSVEWPILLGMVLCFSFKGSRRRVFYIGLLAGVLNDVFCPAPFGISIPIFVLIALGVYAIREEVFSDQLIIYIALGPVGGLLQSLYFMIIFAVTGLRPFSVGLSASRLVGSLLLGLLTTPLVFLVISALRSRRRYQSRWANG